MRMMRFVFCCGVVAGVAGGVAAMGQRTGGGGTGTTSTTGATASTPSYSSTTSGFGRDAPTTFDLDTQRQMEEKRGKALNAERQRVMVKEANQIVQVAAELQATVAKEPQGAQREEALRRVDLIEKLAKNVRERMNGSR